MNGCSENTVPELHLDQKKPGVRSGQQVPLSLQLVQEGDLSLQNKTHDFNKVSERPALKENLVIMEECSFICRIPLRKGESVLFRGETSMFLS